MIDYFLKFTSKTQAKTVLKTVGIDIDMCHGYGWDLYIVGTSYIDDVAQPGFLVNVRARDVIATLDAYHLNPAQPEAVFA